MTLKSIGTKRYEVELIEAESGQYRIKTQIYGNEKIEFSEPVRDYNMATAIFDAKIKKLEGDS